MGRKVSSRNATLIAATLKYHFLKVFFRAPGEMLLCISIIGIQPERQLKAVFKCKILIYKDFLIVENFQSRPENRD